MTVSNKDSVTCKTLRTNYRVVVTGGDARNGDWPAASGERNIGSKRVSWDISERVAWSKDKNSIQTRVKHASLGENDHADGVADLFGRVRGIPAYKEII